MASWLIALSRRPESRSASARLSAPGSKPWLSPLKRQSQYALAAIASCAKEKDFHNRTSML
jgi:hypothetical protein